MRQRAFTLIELLVVISIIGILVSISVVGWVSVAQRGRDSTRKSDLARIKQVLAQQYTDTRTYPIFELNNAGVIYAATWQLTQGGTNTCERTETNKITPKYIDVIPVDPKDSFEYATASCESLTQGQGNRYIYITPTDSNGPISNPTSFALLATLEQNQSDWVIPNMNPLDPNYNGTVFGSWYHNGRENYGNTIGVTANYLVDSRNQ